MNIQELYSAFLTSEGITTDTRSIGKGQIFFALKGNTFNGNEYASKAIESGAILSVIDEEKFVGKQTILVKDVLSTLQELAKIHREKLDIKVLAITGSNGKTTCKELVSRVLSKKYIVAATAGNFNNHIGVPLTILGWPKDTNFAVIEMGANHQKEIEALCEITKPNYGLITSIGKAHIEGFGGVEGVIKGKGELFDYLAHSGGLAFVNQNVEVLRQMAKDKKVHTYFYGNQQDDVHGMIHSTQPFVECDIFMDNQKQTIASNLIGEYNFLNLLSAAAVGFHFGVEPSDIADALGTYIPDNNRSQMETIGTNQIIFDAYNANPTSVAHAIKYLNELQNDHKIAIIGDMWELGDYALDEHQAIVDQLEKYNFNKTVLVGDIFEKTNIPAHFLHFKNYLAAKEWFVKSGIEKSVLLLKGSRGMSLEKIFK